MKVHGISVLHVTPSFYPAYVYGGPTESVYQLCRHLAQNKCEVLVLTTDANGTDKVLEVEKDRDIEIEENLRVRYCRRLLRHTVSPNFVCLLPYYVRWADVIHLTAAYSFPTIPTLMAARLFGKPVVWSTRGALQRWEGSTRNSSKAVWEWICWLVAPTRMILHATSEQEAQATRERFQSFHTIVIPNGVQVPETITHVNEIGVLRLLCLGRLHPIKGIENLLAACNMLKQHADIAWSLTIAGGGDASYSHKLQNTIKELGLREHREDRVQGSTTSGPVQMVGEVVGKDKERLFENADIVVVPSYTENFGVVVAEALAHAVPVIASTGTPWQRVGEMGCGRWVNNDPECLAKAIEEMSRMPLRAMGESGREWMQREFDWERRSREMMKVYESLL